MISRKIAASFDCNLDIILKHPDNHRTVRRALAFQMKKPSDSVVSYDFNCGVCDLFVLITVTMVDKVGVIQRFDFFIPVIIDIREHLIDESEYQFIVLNHQCSENIIIRSAAVRQVFIVCRYLLFHEFLSFCFFG